MAEDRLVIRLNSIEKKALRDKADLYGYSITEYSKLKLFEENTDFTQVEERYISPNNSKHNVFTVTAIHKTMGLVRELLKRQGLKQEEIMEAEERSLEFARVIRDKYGYKVIKAENE